MYRVRYQNNLGGEDEVYDFKTEAEANEIIEHDLEYAKLLNFKDQSNYDYGESWNEDGYCETEIWEIGGDYYERWIREWR